MLKEENISEFFLFHLSWNRTFKQAPQHWLWFSIIRELLTWRGWGRVSCIGPAQQAPPAWGRDPGQIIRQLKIEAPNKLLRLRPPPVSKSLKKLTVDILLKKKKVDQAAVLRSRSRHFKGGAGADFFVGRSREQKRKAFVLWQNMT